MVSTWRKLQILTLEVSLSLFIAQQIFSDMKLFFFLMAGLYCLSIVKSDGQSVNEISPMEISMYGLYEMVLVNDKPYSNPFADVTLTATVKHERGITVEVLGFYDGNGTWKIRFSPEVTGRWKCSALFSDNDKEFTSTFTCTPSVSKGKLCKNLYNPYWLSYTNDDRTLLRSLHVGDRFMASNWDDPTDDGDGNARTIFLDWCEVQGYNMLSIGSLFTNRNEKGRGQGWITPKPWPLNPDEFQKLEIILTDLQSRGMTVFPFAGLFGGAGEWPVKPEEQELYIKYVLSRLGHYGNIIYNVAGPEPFWREEISQYKGEMRKVDIQRLALLIKKYDVYDHLLTVHNEKRATQYGDPFLHEAWYDLSTLQGPTTVNREELFGGLSMNHHPRKPAYAQETLWHGNLYHPKYSEDQLRKNAYAILFAGAILNFADMDGNSSTGFSGTLNPVDVTSTKHAIIKSVWDWFESIPFHRLDARQDLVKNGFCLAKENEEYYVYADTTGQVELFLNTPYDMYSEWINAKNTLERRAGPTVRSKTIFNTPIDGDDWILHVFAKKPEKIGVGNFPDIAIDKTGNVHVVYNRNGLMYKKYSPLTNQWTSEMETGCVCENVNRSDPDIVVDGKGIPHVFCGKEYAYLKNAKWIKSIPGGTRDTELAIDTNDNIFLVHRGGNHGGYVGLKMKACNSRKWVSLPDPDLGNSGYNNHVYPDIVIDQKNTIHVVQRHGPEVEVTYRYSDDGGATWKKSEPVTNDREESPHITIDASGTVIITSGSGEVWERRNGEWKGIGKKIHVHGRMQPELASDKSNNLYITSFGGHFATRYKNAWLAENRLPRMQQNASIGFVETAGSVDFAYVIWEEGIGNADEGMTSDSKIYVAKLYPDGVLLGLP